MAKSLQSSNLITDDDCDVLQNHWEKSKYSKLYSRPTQKLENNIAREESRQQYFDRQTSPEPQTYIKQNAFMTFIFE